MVDTVMHGSTGIVYSTKAPAATAWGDLWTDRYGGRVTMLDDPAEVFGACLKRLGYSVNATDPPDLEKAKQLALQQKPFLRAYLNAEVRDQLIAGDVLAAQSWSVTAQQAIEIATRWRLRIRGKGSALLRHGSHSERKQQ